MIQVLSVASEAYPLVKTGGLGDVVGALPGALAPHDVTVTTLLPGYPAVRAAIGAAPVVHRYDDLMGAQARILAGWLDGHPLLVLDAPALFDRDGGIYGDANGMDWPDNWRRFAALGARGRRSGVRRDSQLAISIFCMPMTGMPAWRRPICVSRRVPAPARPAS